MTTLRHILFGILIGAIGTTAAFGYYEYERRNAKLEEVTPGVKKEHLEQLPPNAKNVVGLGNNWLQFELEVKGENKIYLFKGTALAPSK